MAKEFDAQGFFKAAVDAGYSPDEVNAVIEMRNKKMAESQAATQQAQRVTQAAQAGVLSPEKAFEQGADVGVLAQAKQSQAQASKQPILNTIGRLLESDTKPITGSMQIGSGIGNIPANIIDSLKGRKGQTTANVFEQLKSALALENIEKLKGTGSISDREFQTLQAAASELGRNQSDTDFRKTLERIQSELAAAGKPVGQPQAAPKQATTTSRFIIEVE